MNPIFLFSPFIAIESKCFIFQYQNYEERLYPASKWACTARTVPKTESSPTRSMFVDLFRYFAGDNSDSN